MPSAMEPIPVLLPDEVVHAEHQEHEQQQHQHQHQTLCRIADDWDVQDATAAATVSPDAVSSTISEVQQEENTPSATTTMEPISSVDSSSSSSEEDEDESDESSSNIMSGEIQDIFESSDSQQLRQQLHQQEHCLLYTSPSPRDSR